MMKFQSFSWQSGILQDSGHNDNFIYRVSLEKKVNILGGHNIGTSKQKCICTCVLFWTVSEIELFHCTLYRRAARHVLTRAAKCIDVDGGIFENISY
jgi:hypothetical protein